MSGRRRWRRMEDGTAGKAGGPPAMLSQLRVMNGEGDRFANPPRGRTHRASARSTFRRFFMTLRASVIWRSNSGS